MNYADSAITEAEVPQAADAQFQHVLDTYASECNKVVSIWRAFDYADLDFKPHPRSSSVRDIFKHQLLSERRFFGEFLGAPEPAADRVLPAPLTVGLACKRLVDLSKPRLVYLAAQNLPWWMCVVPFFQVERQRIWIFWRRVLHTAHHRTQLAVYLRLMGKAVPSIYGPTADVIWDGADPTQTVEAARRK